MSKYPDLQAVMISCEQREAARSLTIPQFEALGIPVFVSLSPCAPAGPQQNCIASVHALHHAYAEGKDCLFLEDDVDIDAELFSYFLDRAIEADSVTYFYLHDKPGHMEAFYGRDITDRIMLGKPIRRDLYAIRHQRHMYGTQAVYLPYWFYAPFVKNAMFQATQGSFDVFLSRHVVTRNHQALVALPHPVQHRHDRTARIGMGAANKFSNSFGLEWFESGENEPVELGERRFDFCAENHFALERLLPLWHAFPWANKGSFYIPETALGKTPVGGTVKVAGSLRDSPQPLVIFDSREAWGGPSPASRKFPSREVITVGGKHAAIPFGRIGFPYLHFSTFGEEAGFAPDVTFVFAKAQVFANACRFLPDLARAALDAAASGKPTTGMGDLPTGEPGTDVHSDVGLHRAPTRNASGLDGSGVHDQGMVHHRGNEFDGDGPGVRDHQLFVAGTAAQYFWGDAEPWFRKYGFHASRDSVHLMRHSKVVVSDSEFILSEAAALGKKTVMIDSVGVWSVKPPAVSKVEPASVVVEILEGKREGRADS